MLSAHKYTEMEYDVQLSVYTKHLVVASFLASKWCVCVPATIIFYIRILSSSCRPRPCLAYHLPNTARRAAASAPAARRRLTWRPSRCATRSPGTGSAAEVGYECIVHMRAVLH